MNKKEDQDVDYNEVKCLKAGELKYNHQLSQYFQKLGITEATLFVEGNVKSITNQLLSSEDKKEKGVLLSHKDHENKNQSSFQTLTTGKFQLQSEENRDPSFLNVYNYSSLKILEGVLKMYKDSLNQITFWNIQLRYFDRKYKFMSLGRHHFSFIKKFLQLSLLEFLDQTKIKQQNTSNQVRKIKNSQIKANYPDLKNILMLYLYL